MGNPLRIALFSYVTPPGSVESKLKIIALACVVSAVAIFGSIAVVRMANRDRQITHAIIEAARSLSTAPDSLVPSGLPVESFADRRDSFARSLSEGALPVDSVRAFYASYVMWMRDGRWDSSDVRGLAVYLGFSPAP
jgi:hypothetical protein